MNVIPINNTNADKNAFFFSCKAQIIKKMKFRIINNGIKSVNTLKNGNNLGAKNFSSDTAQRYFEYEQLHRKPQKRKRKYDSLDTFFEEE